MNAPPHKPTPEEDNRWMQRALAQARMAYDEDEVPVGAVVVENGRPLASAYNQCIRLHDSTAHAEMIVLTAAQNALNSRYLNTCTLYLTLEPCPMCAAAMAWTQLHRLVFAAYDEKKGFLQWGDSLLHPKTQYQGGLCQLEAQTLMQTFFAKLRKGTP